MSMALLYTVANFCYFVFMWVTSAVGYMAHADPKLVPSVKWPALGFGMSVLGALFWLWDRYILPALGYRFESQSEHLSGYVVEMNFVVGFFALIEFTYATFADMTPEVYQGR